MRAKMKSVKTSLRMVLAAGICLVAIPSAWSQNSINDFYQVENIVTPLGLDPQVGGMDFTPDGRLAACFHRGEVYTFNPASGEWILFAEGLQEPLGLVAVSDYEIVVMQRPELTRLQDLDRDGKADVYTTLWDGFGMTGNYHEFAFGPIMDDQGNFLVSLNTASNGASIREEIRGEFHPIGLPRDQFYNRKWSDVKNIAGRMYARVPWRGWVMKVSPTGEASPFASGFRSPTGLGFDRNGELFVTDNQGDWIATSPCYHVEEGGFYGHPASLIWKEGWDRNPLEVDAAEFDAMRNPAAFLFPHGEVANSPTQPLMDSTGGKFGPFGDQMLVGEMNVPRILRLVQDEINGTMQGAVVTFMDGGGLRRGICRLAFAPDNSLYVGQTALSWAGGAGIQKISFTGKQPMELLAIKAVPGQFKLSFSQPIDPASLESLTKEFKTWTYKYHKSYGSPKIDEQSASIKNIRIADKPNSLIISVPPHKKGYLHDFNLAGLKSHNGTSIVNGRVSYHMIEVPGSNEAR